MGPWSVRRFSARPSASIVTGNGPVWWVGLPRQRLVLLLLLGVVVLGTEGRSEHDDEDEDEISRGIHNLSPGSIGTTPDRGFFLIAAVDYFPTLLSRLLTTMRTFCSFVILTACGFLARAEVQPPLPLWPNGAPGALGTSSNDVPALTPYLPDPAMASGAAIVICPGGGYGGLADHEGRDYALWLNQHGVTAFVLRYRLGSHGYRHPAMLQDAARAVRLVRAQAADWEVDPKRVGIMGSSAGGHLASTLLTHFDAGKPDADDPIERQGSRPDLGILCYAVISMGQHTHQGSKRNLLGDAPAPELVRSLSNELQVTKDTPPCFVWHTWEDKGVPIENSLSFVAALQKNGVRFDLHIYERGPHGLGLGTRDWKPELRHPWTRDCEYWLKQRGFAK